MHRSTTNFVQPFMNLLDKEIFFKGDNKKNYGANYRANHF